MIIITDQKNEQKKLESALSKEGILSFNSISIAEGISYLNSGTPTDLLILYLLKSNPKHLEILINCFNSSTRILVTTKHKFSQYVNVDNIVSTDYVSAIINYIKTFKPIKLQEKENKKGLLIKINDKYKRIRFDNIDYISSDGKYVAIKIKGRIYSIRSSLKEMEEILPNNFLRVHASYIVNTDKIESIELQEQNIELDTGSLPFSRKYKSTILNRFHLG